MFLRADRGLVPVRLQSSESLCWLYASGTRTQWLSIHLLNGESAGSFTFTSDDFRWRSSAATLARATVLCLSVFLVAFKYTLWSLCLDCKVNMVKCDARCLQ